ncbi:O-acetyl-ADP-ribose deacetylase [Streptacidiphilus monticola]|jgi:O-acetyl-ADP-ribose deacetylase (regulator of RNase III)|uniref:O-acetyl-ADP-ribose deacetylase n=1 Tax=Streptacidiphilus monticola TaxID=2161674 RepID=A0ABW1FWS6_9ACTN
MEITLVQGDITQQQVDAIVNAANSSLLGGGGVDGAIHRKGGPEILAECRALRAGHYGGGLPAGQAVATTAGRLQARWVVHTVGPVYDRARGQELAGVLASCYRESLRVADGLGARTIAFPAVSTGVYRWPMEGAARIALGTVREAGGALRSIQEARFVLFDGEAFGVFQRVWHELLHGSMVD